MYELGVGGPRRIGHVDSEFTVDHRPSWALRYEGHYGEGPVSISVTIAMHQAIPDSRVHIR